MSRDPVVLSQVKVILEQISKLAPGHAVELRIPPYAAIQCCDGPKHTRGTPPSVVEMSADVLFALIKGSLDWADGIDDGRITASGERSDLSQMLQLVAQTIHPTDK
ncbi:MAG: sterol carrier family protein [Actinomycetota bacterium]